MESNNGLAQGIKSRSNTLKWIILAILALIGIIVPQLPWSGAKSPMQAIDPPIDEMRSDYLSAESWLALDADIRSLNTGLEKRRLDIQYEKLNRFNATSAAEQALQRWIREHHQKNQVALAEDPRGRQLIADLRQSYVDQEEARLSKEAITAVQSALPQLRMEVRKHLVDRTSDISTVNTVKSTLAALRCKAAKGNADRQAVAEQIADESVQAALRTMFRVP